MYAIRSYYDVDEQIGDRPARARRHRRGDVATRRVGEGPTVPGDCAEEG